jgi:hypothetical protein
MFNASFDATLAQYEGSVRQEGATGRLDLRNDNFDTGTETGPGEYPLADATYAELLHRLAKRQFTGTTAPLRDAILKYYDEPLAGTATKKQKREWEESLTEVNELKAFTPAVGGA